MKKYYDVLLRKRTMLCMFLLFFCFSFSNAQTKVEGLVSDFFGAPLPGASIIEKGTTNGTQTDFDGKYTIQISSSNAILVVSYLGYLDTEVPVDNQRVVNITLQENVSTLDEVVLVGYGRVKKSDATGAVTGIKAKDLNKGAALTTQQLLSGKAAGVNVSLGSGRPGSKSTVRIRGTNSLNFNNEPLYVIDGVPVSFQDNSFAGTTGSDDRSSTAANNPLSLINPADIERIDVLKDASAKAIYGARAANGVVIVTTKKGKEGKNVLTLDTYVGFASVSRTLPVLSAAQVREYAANNNVSNFDDRGANTDWQDELFRSALNRGYTISMSGGSNNTHYSGSLGYQEQEGVIINSANENITGRLNLTSKFMGDKLTLNLNVLYANEKANNVPSVGGIGGDGGGDVIRDVLRANPTIPVRDENSPYSGGFSYVSIFTQNPIEQALLFRNLTTSRRLLTNISLNYEIVEDLNFKTSIGYTQEDIERKSYVPLSTRIGSENGGFGNLEARNNNNRLIETTLNYNKQLSKNHRVNLLAGYSWQEFTNASNRLRTSQFVEDVLGFNNLAAGGVVNFANNGISKSRIISFFGRVNYDLFDKYLITATLRRDGSTRFGKDTKWGLFPSAALAWKVSDEDFLKDSSVISQLKLRASYGITGNQEISNFGSLSLLSLGLNVNPEIGLFAKPTTLANPNLKWETTSETNIGLDFGFFNNRFTGTVEVYEKVTDDLILRFNVPAPTAVSTRLENVGEVSNKGIEFSFNYDVVRHQDWNFNFYGNIATNKNEIVSLSKGALITPAFGLTSFTAPSPQQQSPIRIQRVGESLNSLWGLDFIGFDKNGREQFRDIDNNGVINTDDRTIIGQTQPDYTYGFGFNLGYKRLSLSTSFRGVQGVEVLNSLRNDLENLTVVPENNALDVILTNGATVAPSGQVSDRFVEDGSFLRMENATLNYNVNTAKLGFLQSLNLSLTGQNLFVLTDFTGYDPEVSIVAYTNYPRARTILMGLKAQF
ncbi:SusC/RagA family TonB-linked outer membrane protein [Flavivirga eckloniae]|uniref:TonB-dependent receptor n=1 Tax=Flavivirga eckloniae TaxID=1803846 RepID=A0A2K9PNZ1_9FLAO|nr:TonB-dependent receptor [Flavivirga eckloniae]AUP78528.1 TonB-dependent receptor [Flavivirga eckloniae]